MQFPLLNHFGEMAHSILFIVPSIHQRILSSSILSGCAGIHLKYDFENMISQLPIDFNDEQKENSASKAIQIWLN